jgi:hypothetical protein
MRTTQIYKKGIANDLAIYQSKPDALIWPLILLNKQLSKYKMIVNLV